MSSVFRLTRIAPCTRARLNLEPLESREVPATFVVNTVADESNPNDGTISLREAINSVNASTEASNTIMFDVNLVSPVSVVGSALPAITKPVNIVGPGANALAIKAGSGVSGSVFTFAAPSGTAESISGLTITGGQGTAGTSTVFTPTGGTAQSPVVVQPTGGGITNNGDNLTLSQVMIEGNSTAGAGGGILNTGGALVIQNSTIDSNTATVTNSTSSPAPVTIGGLAGTQVVSSFGTANGGGIEVTGGSLMLTQDTITKNSAGANGGGVDIGAASSALTVAINNSTITNNTATGPGGGVSITPGTPPGVGAGTMSGSVTISSTIVANNTGGGGNNDVTGSPQASSDHNLIGNGTGLGANSIVNGTDGNQVGTASAPINPLLGTLLNNGGTTLTMLPQPGSPAINAGAANGLVSDQRGYVPRVVGGSADVGSVEVGATPAGPSINQLINALVIANLQQIFAQAPRPPIVLATIAAITDVNGDGYPDVVAIIGIRTGSGRNSHGQIFKVVFDGLSTSGGTIGGPTLLASF